MGIPYETVTLTAFGRNKALYANMLEEGCLYFIKINTCYWKLIVLKYNNFQI